MTSRFPPVPSAEAWPSVHALPLDAWRPALAWAEGAFRLPDGPWERLSGGEDSAVFARGDAVVKLVPPCYAADAAREAAVLPRLELPVPTPRLYAVAAAEGWTALHVGRLAGICAERRWSALAPAARRALVHGMGEVLAAFRATPLVAADGDAAALLERWRVRARRHEDAGFAGVDAFLERHLPADAPVALVHVDLHPGNAMLDADDRLCGVLDFVASRAFHPRLDLVTPAVFCARGDPALLRTLVEAAALGDPAPEELAAWHVLHPFSDLRRDLRWAGRSLGPSLERQIVDLWRR